MSRQVTVPLDCTGTAIDAQGLTRVGFEGSTAINRKASASRTTRFWRRAA
ncbi:hypothetical protein [Nonomuraea sp. NPDC003201]